MKSKQHQNNKQSHHDDCDDCKREKKQNQALISIYERLQAIDNSSRLMRRSLEKHKNEFEKTSSKFKQFSQNLSNAPKQSRADIQLKNLGFDMAYSMMYECLNGREARKNRSLKFHINQYNVLDSKTKFVGAKKQLHNQHNQQNYSKLVGANKDQKIQNKSVSFIQETQNNQESKCSQQIQFKNCFDLDKMVKQQEQTHSTRFYRQSFSDNKKIKALNLWLYQEDRNKELQNKLYRSQKIPHLRQGKPTNNKRYNLLPSLAKASSNS